MTRLILVTFALLGWTFYVVSGGSDFEPRGLRSDSPQRVAETPVQVPESAPVEQLVTRVVLKPTDVIAPLPDAKPVLDDDEAEALLADVAAGLQANPSLFDDQGTTLTLASLEQGVAGLQQIKSDAEPVAVEISAVPEPEKDIREVSGTRVNMRDGPGTIYPVIGKATLGQKVEVLSESGTGWLRLRVLQGQQVGWISASLVRKTTN